MTMTYYDLWLIWLYYISMQFVVKHLDRIIGATRLRFVRIVGPGVFVSRRAQRDRRGLWREPAGHVHKKQEFLDVLDLWRDSWVVVASAEPDKLLRIFSLLQAFALVLYLGMTRTHPISRRLDDDLWLLVVSSQLENSPCCNPRKSPGKVANCNQTATANSNIRHQI